MKEGGEGEEKEREGERGEGRRAREREREREREESTCTPYIKIVVISVGLCPVVFSYSFMTWRQHVQQLSMLWSR